MGKAAQYPRQTMTTNGMLVGNGVQFPYHER